MTGRPERHDADYFPFYVKDGKTLRVLESKYGCVGTGFFTNVLRFLCQRPDHHFSILDEGDRVWFFSYMKCEEEIGLDMLELMAKTGKIDKDLWKQNQVIASQDFLDCLSELYKRRKNSCITMDQIRAFYRVSSDNNTDAVELIPTETPVSSDNNTQSKVKQSKAKQSKVNISSDSPESSDDKNCEFQFEEFWRFYPRKIEKQKALKCWKTRIKEKHDPEDIIKAAYNYAEVCKIQNTEENYIKHPATFLGPNKPFLDYLTMPKVTPPASKPGSRQAVSDFKPEDAGTWINGVHYPEGAELPFARSP